MAATTAHDTHQNTHKRHRCQHTCTPHEKKKISTKINQTDQHHHGVKRRKQYNYVSALQLKTQYDKRAKHTVRWPPCTKIFQRPWRISHEPTTDLPTPIFPFCLNIKPCLCGNQCAQSLQDRAGTTSVMHWHRDRHIQGQKLEGGTTS